jgi:hypothetical protein
MIRQASEEADDVFPIREAFVDCGGQTREFVIDFSRSDDRRFLTAVEVSDSDGRYRFEAMSESDPYLAVGRLRQKIQRELSTRYLRSHGERLHLSHEMMKGRITYGGVAVDGRFVSFDEFVDLFQTYEGFHFSLEIRDPTES